MEWSLYFSVRINRNICYWFNKSRSSVVVKYFIAIAMFVLSPSCLTGQGLEPADTIYRNGNVLTVNSKDETVSAFAVKGR